MLHRGKRGIPAANGVMNGQRRPLSITATAANQAAPLGTSLSARVVAVGRIHFCGDLQPIRVQAAGPILGCTTTTCSAFQSIAGEFVNLVSA